MKIVINTQDIGFYVTMIAFIIFTHIFILPNLLPIEWMEFTIVHYIITGLIYFFSRGLPKYEIVIGGNKK